MFEEVESIVGGHFGVSPNDIRNGNKSRDITDARHFLWYILHTIMGYRGSVISREFRVTTRNVYYSVAIIRDGIRTQPFYANHFSEIQKELKYADII